MNPFTKTGKNHTNINTLLEKTELKLNLFDFEVY